MKALAAPAPRQLLAASLLLCALLLLPAARHGLEASMWRHMLLQFPLWLLAGALSGAALPAASRQRLARYNAHGISGLLLASLVLALLMVPRVLDLALYRADVEAAKFIALYAAGAALYLSWSLAGRIVQAFFLGNLLPMMVVVGQLYIDSPLRLCNAYLLDDQERLGQWLIALAALLALCWLARVLWQLVQREQAAEKSAEKQPQTLAASALTAIKAE